MNGERCVICAVSLRPSDGGLCDAHKYDEQLTGATGMNRAFFPWGRTRDRSLLAPPFTCGQAQGYRPADERDLKAEREAGFEDGFFVGIVGASLVITGLIALFSYALGV